MRQTHDTQADIAALMNAGAGRARIQTIQQASDKLKAALRKTVVDCEGDNDQAKLAARGLGELVALVDGWAKEAERLAQLEQPALEEGALRAAKRLMAPRSLSARLQRAARAALAELKA